jgi:hypothetical protein
MTATATITRDWLEDFEAEVPEELVIALGDLHDRGVESLCVGESR